MKKGFMFVVTLLLVMVSSVYAADSKEVLLLKQKMFTEQQAKLQAQAKLLQIEFNSVSSELNKVNAELTKVADDEAAKKVDKK